MAGRGAALASLLTLALPAQSAAPLAPLPARRSLESIAQSLQKSGWPAEATTVVKVLQELGHEPAALNALRASLAKLEPKAAKTPTGGDKLAPAVKKAAAALAALLPAAGEQRTALAHAILELDGEIAEAQRALGRVEHDGRWIAVADVARAQRRRDIQIAVANASRLPVDVKIEVGDQPLFRELLQSRSVRVSCGPLTVESEWPSEKVVRVVRSTLRAAAMSRFLVVGKLELPDAESAKLSTLHVASKAHYDQAIAWAQQRGGFAPKVVEPLQLSGVFLASGKFVHRHVAEAQVEASLLYHLLDGDHHAWVLAGHTDWLCRTFFGEPIPGIVWEEKGRKLEARTATAAELQEREWRQHFAKAGLLGARSWLSYLAERSQDPPYSRCFVDQVGKLSGDDLLKATFASEFLHESNALGALWPLTASADFPKALQQAVGLGVEAFDPAFREWLVGTRPGMAQVLAADRSLPADVAAALGKLVELRKAAMAMQRWSVDPRPDPRVDRTLSAGARLHATYLGLHPEQAAAWPDAHEEYPDREGFSVEGAWAGGHAVIASGMKSLGEGIDGWMGTFYHRLPLLEPGLLQCGMAHAAGIAVLDASSMVIPADEITMIAIWPPADAKNVPLRFVPELPNPLPGIDQTKLGYPITVQFGESLLAGGGVTMALHEGTAGGAIVDCHWSTPAAPTNPELAPRSAWCLMPKAALSPNKKYTVTCKLGADEPFEWSFTTGGR